MYIYLSTLTNTIYKTMHDVHEKQLYLAQFMIQVQQEFVNFLSCDIF